MGQSKGNLFNVKKNVHKIERSWWITWNLFR